MLINEEQVEEMGKTLQSALEGMNATNARSIARLTEALERIATALERSAITRDESPQPEHIKESCMCRDCVRFRCHEAYERAMGRGGVRTFASDAADGSDASGKHHCNTIGLHDGPSCQCQCAACLYFKAHPK